MIELNDMPLAACAEEMPNSATSVAVSKPEPEQETDRQHMPALGDEPEQRTEDARQESPLVEQDVEIVLGERLASLHRLKGLVDRNLHQNVDEGDGEQKERRPLCMTPPTAFSESKRDLSAEAAKAPPTDSIPTTADWPSEKKKPTPPALALLHELARDVVDRRDMVGVDRVAEAERISEQRRSEQNRLGVQREQRPEPDENIAADQNGVDAINRRRSRRRLHSGHLRQFQA